MTLAWGEIAYEAYRDASDGKSLVSGAPIPAWADLSPGIRSAWEASAQAVRQSCINLIGQEGHGGDFANRPRKSAAASNPIIKYDARGRDVFSIYQDGSEQRANSYASEEDAMHAARVMNGRLNDSRCGVEQR